MAERVEPARIRKGMTVDGAAIMLDIALAQVQAVCNAYADGALPAGANDQLRVWCGVSLAFISTLRRLRHSPPPMRC